MENRKDPPPAQWPRRERFACLIGLALLVGAVVQIGWSYGACPQDDAFISFRYAQNLVRGHGLVFNPGEWVEGYSNLSWTLIMAAIIALGEDPIRASAVLGVVSIAATMVLLVWMRPGRLRPAMLVAPALLAVDAEMILEGVEGLETTFYMLLVTAAVLRAWHELQTERAHWISSLLFGLAALTRPEAPLLFALLHLGAWWSADQRSGQLRRSLVAAASLGTVLLLLTAWRLHTYGMPLPNTFYAKTGGFALPRGLEYLGAHVAGHLLLWTLVVLRISRGGLSRSEKIAVLICSGQLAYVAWIGGDFKPTGRFILPILPLLCILAQQGLLELIHRARGPMEARQWSPRKTRLSLLLLIGAPTAIVADHDLSRGLEISTKWAGERKANLESRRLVGSFLKEQLPPDTVMAIHSAGAIPWFSELPTIDMWGLSNAHIAHTSPEDMGQGLAGHEKTDPDYVFSLEPFIYLPEDKVFTFKYWQLEPDPDFPADFEQRYESKSIPFDGNPIRHLNFWVRRGLMRCLNSSVVFEGPTASEQVFGRYQVAPCADSELQTWADLDQDEIPSAGTSCCFASTIRDSRATELDLRRFIPSLGSGWDCDDDSIEVGVAGQQGCP